MEEFLRQLRLHRLAEKILWEKRMNEFQAFADLICPPTKKQLNQRKIDAIVKPFIYKTNYGKRI